jgi:hypothetical protein
MTMLRVPLSLGPASLDHRLDKQSLASAICAGWGASELAPSHLTVKDDLVHIGRRAHPPNLKG